MIKKKVFLAEDDGDDRFLAGEIFKELYSDNFELKLFESGTELINYIETIDLPLYPQLIILDQNMPKLTGKETLAHIKSQSNFSNVPVVMYSTYFNQGFVDDCIKMGVKFVEIKPDSYKKLKEMIGKFLISIS